ncbi:hypothetical protein [Rathayibacter rathayi]|uniref:Uncharacterized protein n=1 Tax=Rathayibacter rathayi TaxID=33887 RepID=A0ABX5AH19_RATRA|nr:hypothetical protein [Rathayibacter rathayi]PPF23112.1 hypothetical protein C5C34_09795 [Rathayibacter rathayi]PPF51630.1 hypothetical protein C5C08_02155 [Rathayibacter rathayi]PPG47051.1 hypothetical protein C5C20_02150 [Rathayibacter rathayi]PPG94074.1 hypothetical protein C5C22_09665 [Rathayibacter rathayi]PPH79293.1 hypothetical protein C5C40_02875 [Rathayibacter rathayi]
MRASAARKLPTYPQMRAFAATIAWATGEHVLADLDDAGGHAVILLPNQGKLHTETRKGPRKLPVFISWSTGPVLMIPRGHGPVETTWRVVERGITHSGTVTFGVDQGHDVVRSGPYPADAAEPEVHRVTSGSALARLRRNLQRAGENAEWTFVQTLEAFVAHMLDLANRRVAREIEGLDEDDDWTGGERLGVLDDITLEKLNGELLWGGPSNQSGVSAVRTMVRRIATTPINQQPIVSYLDRNISARAESAIRAEIHDPHIGPKIRRFAATHRATDLASFIAAYRSRHPEDELGPRRATRALTAGRTVNAVTHPLFEEDHSFARATRHDHDEEEPLELDEVGPDEEAAA